MKQNQRGFGTTEVIIGIAMLTVLVFVGWKAIGAINGATATNPQATDNSNNTQAAETSENEPDLELQNLGLSSMDDIDITTQAVREFESQGLKGFYVFGDMLSGNRQNPNFEYASLKADTKVVSAIDGVVGFIREQPDTNDYEVFIQPKNDSKWTIGYDHIKNVKVEKDATIKAGDVIGEPAMQNNGLLRFEMQVNKDENGTTTHICPTTLLAGSVKQKYINELTSMQDKWESVTGFELYHVAAQNPVGCINQTLSPEQAEGRS